MFTTETLDVIAERFVDAFKKTGIIPRRLTPSRKEMFDGKFCGCVLVAYAVEKTGYDTSIYACAEEDFGIPMTNGIWQAFDDAPDEKIAFRYHKLDDALSTYGMQYAHGVYIGCKIRELTNPL